MLGPHPSGWSRCLLGASLVIALLAPSRAQAWHDDGHRIVGEIAERNLSSEARERVTALLADMPEHASLATAATWADQKAKLDPTFDFAFSSHYVNVEGETSPRELHRLCLAASGCVATGIAYYVEVLRSTRATRQQRAEALRFLIHFVGDIHQPLHAGHAADKGGNEITGLELLEYTQGDETTNLHAAWDGGILAITQARAGWDWQRHAAELAKQIDDEDRARWAVGSSYDWIEESRLLAAADGYLHADGKTPIRSGDTLGEDWYQRNLPVVELRLQQAGVRLALILEDIYGAE